MAELTAPAAASGKKLTTKDLINVGIFTAIYMVVMFALSMIGFLGPIAMFVGHSLSILANGIVIALFMARVPKFGGFTILSIILCSAMFLTGHPWYGFGGIILGLIGDVVARSGNYTSVLRNSLGYAIHSVWYILPLFPIFFDSAGYREYIAKSMSEEYANDFMNLVTPAVVVGWGVAAFIIAFIGGLLGHRVLRRHFKRAGLAG